MRCANPEEAPEQVMKPGPNGGAEEVHWRCPHGGQAWLDASFVMCSGGYNHATCPTLAIIAANHSRSHANVVAFGEHLPTTTGTEDAHDPHSTFLLHAKKVKK